MPRHEQFDVVNPHMSLAALHDRMIVFAQDVRGGLMAAPQEPVPARLPTLQYLLRDGAVLLRRERDGSILLVPETGNEAVLQAFVELGLNRQLTQAQFDALVSYTFNTGARGAQEIFQRVERGDLRGAANLIMSNTYSTQRGRRVFMPGLVPRRRDESAPFLEGN